MKGLGRNEYLAMAFGAVMGVALLGTVLLAWNEPVPHNQAQSAEAHGAQDRNGNSWTITFGREKPAKVDKKHHWYDIFAEHAPDWFVALFTGVLVIVTGRLVTSTNRLWEAGERQLSLTSDTARRQLRAYMSVEVDPDFRPVIQKDRIEVHIKATNRGATPAYGFIQWAGIGIAPYPPGESFFPGARKARRTGEANLGAWAPVDVGPNDHYSIIVTRDRPMSDEEASVISAGTEGVYVFGMLYYRDAFRRRRFTKFTFAARFVNGGLAMDAVSTDNHSN